MEQHILHLNIANFYIAVVKAMQPRLLSYPVAVVTSGKARQVLIDISHEASQLGLYRGMLLDIAQRRCPDLVVLPPSPKLYARANKAILGEIGRLSPSIEPAGPGHFFIDLTGTEKFWGVSIDTADGLRKTIKNEFGLDPVVGLAKNKLVSKIATRVIKPTGLCEVIPGGEADFIAPLPIPYLPGLDHKFILMLLQFNLKLIRDLLSFSEDTFYESFGEKTAEIHKLARGEDDTPVRKLTTPEPSIQESFIFKGQTNDYAVMENALFYLVSECGFKLRKMRLGAKKIGIFIRYADGINKQGSLRISTPISGNLSLYEKGLLLLNKIYTRRIRLTRLSIKLSLLSFPYGQLDLFGKVEKEKNLMTALDTIRSRFGPKAIVFYGREREGDIFIK